MFTNPGASRTLDPTNLSLLEVVGLHDRKLSDADVNLIQSLQDFKRGNLLANQVSSGALTYNPFKFSARGPSPQPLSFQIPAYNVLFNGQVVTIGGNAAPNLSSNNVVVPTPSFWTPGSSSASCAVYIVFLELWYQRVTVTDQGSSVGYYVDASGNLYYYPNGCVNASPFTMIVNDATDPFEGIKTTERSQIQWALRVQAVDPGYDFTKYNFGLDPGATSAQTVYAQAGQPSLSSYSYTNMGSINGDTALWRAGDGNYLNYLGTLDGYSYAMPVAVVFQRNLGVYSFNSNPLGSASATVNNSGVLSSAATGRPDGKFADVIYPEDVVDTRSTISLPGFDHAQMIKEGFVDLISGQTRTAIGRGITPGGQPLQTGSMIDYAVAMSPTAVTNIDTIGSFDGYRNGFSAADYTSYTTQAVTVNQKSVGTNGARWAQGDAFVISLPAASVATIEYIQVQGLVTSSVNATNTPVLFLSGQISVTGLGTKTVTVTIAKNLANTTYDPGSNPIYCTLGVEYPASGGIDLRQVVNNVWGGTLVDGQSGKTLPVYGVSDYAVSSNLPTLANGAFSAIAYNPSYSNLVFGVRVQTTVAGSTGVYGIDASASPITTFSISLNGLNGTLKGLYALSAVDQLTGVSYTITSRAINGTNFTLIIQGQVPTTSNLIMTFIARDTVQVSYNAPIKAITHIEETVLAGTATTDATYHMDPRISVVSVKNNPGVNNTVVFATTNGVVTGIAGDDTNKLIWVQDITGNYNAVQVSSATFSNGFVTLIVPPSVNLQIQPFFVVAALLPALASNSQMFLTETYVPYQGEGVAGRDYEVVKAEDFALVTTNGTGTAPVPGLQDVYPYNREFPVSVSLPAQIAWSDSTLLNQPVASLADSNYVAKLFENVEHTFEVPTHTNDFIQPISMDKRKTFQLSTGGSGRGFARMVPHLGFAIQPLTTKSALGANVTTTTSSLTLYVNNVKGNDSNDGMTVYTPFLTIGAAIAALPGVLRHPCSIQLMPTGVSYSINALQNQLQVVPLGDNVVLSAKYYALGILTNVLQDSGRLVITAQAGTNGNIVFDNGGFNGFGDGPVSAFFINGTRVIFNQITFQNFTAGAAIKGQNAYIEFLNCSFISNAQSGSFEQGTTVTLSNSSISQGNQNAGFVLSSSDMVASGNSLTVQVGTTPGPFFVSERGSSLDLFNHSQANETNVTAGTVIAEAFLNSSIECEPDFTSAGSAGIYQASVLTRGVAINPFVGGINTDSSSNIITNV